MNSKKTTVTAVAAALAVMMSAAPAIAQGQESRTTWGTGQVNIGSPGNQLTIPLSSLSSSSGPSVTRPSTPSGGNTPNGNPGQQRPPQQITQADINRSAAELRKRVYEEVNRHRVQNGLKPLRIDATLENQSSRWSNSMAQHSMANGDSLELSHSGDYVFENVALLHTGNKYDHYSYAKGNDPIRGWKNSPGHNKNMLRPDVTKMGVGVTIVSRSHFAFLTLQLDW